MAWRSNALEGRGAHLITVNDYLAKRDAQWLGQLYHSLGLSVGVIQHDASFLFDPAYDAADKRLQHLKPCTRQEAYHADITYGTNNEFGFDYLRDNLIVHSMDQCVQRDLNFAIVDEVDSILIDEARTPLIISGPVSHSTSSDLFARLKPKVERVVGLQARLVNELVAFAEKERESPEKEEEVARALLKAKRGAPKNNRF